MSTFSRRWSRRGQHGFSLTELLVVTTILGIIGFALTEAVILGLRTTDGTAASSSRSSATQALASYFTDDAHSAELVSNTDPACAGQPVLLRLTWTDGVARTVSYGLDPVVGDEQDLVRWSCIGSGSSDRKILGHFSSDRAVGSGPPVEVQCAGCPSATPIAPASITLKVRAAQILPTATPETDHTLTLTVQRRAAT